MERALITGITGQDGSCLAEFLLDKGYEVHGPKCRASSFNTDRVDHLYLDTIRELAFLVRDIAGYTGAVVFDRSKPDGTPQKLLDIGRLRSLGWAPRIPLRQGIADTWRWFLEHEHEPVP